MLPRGEGLWQRGIVYWLALLVDCELASGFVRVACRESLHTTLCSASFRVLNSTTRVTASSMASAAVNLQGWLQNREMSFANIEINVVWYNGLQIVHI